MDTKKMVWLGVFVGSTIGSIIGSFFDHNNFLGTWSLLLGGVGGVIGIWLGYKIANG